MCIYGKEKTKQKLEFSGMSEGSIFYKLLSNVNSSSKVRNKIFHSN